MRLWIGTSTVKWQFLLFIIIYLQNYNRDMGFLRLVLYRLQQDQKVLISKGCQAAEERLTLVVQQKRDLHKARAASTSSTPDTSLVCPSRAKIGCISQLRTHRNQ